MEVYYRSVQPTYPNNNFRTAISEMCTGCTLLDKKINEDILREQQIFNSKDKIRYYRRQWTEHLERMAEDSVPKLACIYKAGRRRDFGRLLNN
jgi:deoxyadenosine/deoxycytidine kinase